MVRATLVVAACALAGTAVAAPFEVPKPAVCRVVRIDDDGEHVESVWRGTTDGRPRSLVVYDDDGGSTRYVWTPLRHTAGEEDVYATSIGDGGQKRWLAVEQTLDEEGRVVASDDGTCRLEWSYDKDGGVNGYRSPCGDLPMQVSWTSGPYGLTSVTSGVREPQTRRWTWASDGRLMSLSTSGWSETYGGWNDMGLPTTGEVTWWDSEGGSGTETDTFTWDDRGRPTTDGLVWTDDEDGGQRVDVPGGDAYAWDANGRLVLATQYGYTETLAWNPDGTLQAFTVEDDGTTVRTEFQGVCPGSWSDAYIPKVALPTPLPEAPTVPRPFGW